MAQGHGVPSLQAGAERSSGSEGRLAVPAQARPSLAQSGTRLSGCSLTELKTMSTRHDAWDGPSGSIPNPQPGGGRDTLSKELDETKQMKTPAAKTPGTPTPGAVPGTEGDEPASRARAQMSPEWVLLRQGPPERPGDSGHATSSETAERRVGAARPGGRGTGKSSGCSEHWALSCKRL